MCKGLSMDKKAALTSLNKIANILDIENLHKEADILLT